MWSWPGPLSLHAALHGDEVRALAEVGVDRAQREIWLGYRRTGTTRWYESFDPEFLREVALATEMVAGRLDDLTSRTLMLKSVRQCVAVFRYKTGAVGEIRTLGLSLTKGVLYP